MGGRVAGRQDPTRPVVTPAVGAIGGVLQVVHGQGDGWVRGTKRTGKNLGVRLETLQPKTRSTDGSRQLVLQLEPEASNTCMPDYERVTSRDRDWTRAAAMRPAIDFDGLVGTECSTSPTGGFLHALDARPAVGLEVDMFAAMWGSTMVADGRSGRRRCDVRHAGRPEKKILPRAMDSSVLKSSRPTESCSS